MRKWLFALIFTLFASVVVGRYIFERLESTIELSPNGEVIGTVIIDKGACTDTGEVSGSWFRMIEPGGSVEKGPFITNYDSLCSDETYSLLVPGSLGLRLNEFQKHPTPAFDEATNGLANEIFQPLPFYTVNMAFSTESPDPLSGEKLSPPRFFVGLNGSSEKDAPQRLTANLQSIYVAWNGEYFEQGSPHPEGFKGATKSPVGTINVETGRFTLDWVSQVDAGAFDGFIGEWHLEGFVQPKNK